MWDDILDIIIELTGVIFEIWDSIRSKRNKAENKNENKEL